jgi:hypothetical protein
MRTIQSLKVQLEGAEVVVDLPKMINKSKILSLTIHKILEAVFVAQNEEDVEETIGTILLNLDNGHLMIINQSPIFRKS